MDAKIFALIIGATTAVVGALKKAFPAWVTGKEELLAFEAQLDPLARIYIDWREGKVATWKNTTACITKGFACEYLPMCARGDRSQFVQKKGGRRIVHNENNKA